MLHQIPTRELIGRVFTNSPYTPQNPTWVHHQVTRIQGISVVLRTLVDRLQVLVIVEEDLTVIVFIGVIYVWSPLENVCTLLLFFVGDAFHFVMSVNVFREVLKHARSLQRVSTVF